MDRLAVDLRRVLVLGALIACGLLAASCTPEPVYANGAELAVEQAVGEGAAQVREAVAEPAAEAQVSVAEAVVPAIVGAREIVQDVLPPSEALPETAMGGVSPAAVALIVRWEISGPAYYTARLQRPVWPGAASGVTWGVGYDGGHQTRQVIARDWVVHPHAPELATTSGIVGTRARAALPAYRHILTPLPMAQDVFADSTLPTYAALTERTFRDGWDRLPADARGALVSVVFNRGASMRGDARREMRALRDECVPAGDLHCIAARIREMKRLWPTLRGLRDRRESEAVLVENAS
jgi:hypothetical protein